MTGVALFKEPRQRSKRLMTLFICLTATMVGCRRFYKQLRYIVIILRQAGEVPKVPATARVPKVPLSMIWLLYLIRRGIEYDKASSIQAGEVSKVPATARVP